MVAPSVSRKRPIVETSPFKSSKRPRVNGRPHETYFFPDGNVVLQLREVQFKVHLSQLARKSNSFRELFDGSDHDTTPDGLRLFTSDDDPRDFEALLRCVYDGMQLLDTENVNFNLLASIVRASTRYGFFTLRDWAVKCLEALHPSNIDTFTSGEHYEQAVVAVALARQCNLQRILKPAFYRMISSRQFTPPPSPGTRLSENANGKEKEKDITNGHGDSSSSDDFALSRQDLVTAMYVSREFTERWLSIATSVPNPRCDKPKSKCGNVFINHWWSRIVKVPHIFQHGVFDPLGSLDKLIAIDWSADGVCADCLANERASWKRLKIKIWDDMDEWIRLENSSRTPSTMSAVGMTLRSQVHSQAPVLPKSEQHDDATILRHSMPNSKASQKEKRIVNGPIMNGVDRSPDKNKDKEAEMVSSSEPPEDRTAATPTQA